MSNLFRCRVVLLIKFNGLLVLGNQANDLGYHAEFIKKYRLPAFEIILMIRFCHIHYLLKSLALFYVSAFALEKV